MIQTTISGDGEYKKKKVNHHELRISNRFC